MADAVMKLCEAVASRRIGEQRTDVITIFYGLQSIIQSSIYYLSIIPLHSIIPSPKHNGRSFLSIIS